MGGGGGGGGGVRKYDILGGMKILWIFFWGHHKTGLFFFFWEGGVISMHFRVFSYGQGTEWEYFGGVAKISNIFGVCLIFISFNKQ